MDPRSIAGWTVGLLAAALVLTLFARAASARGVEECCKWPSAVPEHPECDVSCQPGNPCSAGLQPGIPTPGTCVPWRPSARCIEIEPGVQWKVTNYIYRCMVDQNTPCGQTDPPAINQKCRWVPIEAFSSWTTMSCDPILSSVCS